MNVAPRRPNGPPGGNCCSTARPPPAGAATKRTKPLTAGRSLTALVRVKRGGDLITADQYESFDLILDWRISKAGNSGVIYHVTEDDDRASRTGPECQILDNIDGEDPQRAGWCYGLYQPPDDPKTGKPLDATKPVGQWNTMRILIDGNHVEHWMNGIKYVEYELGSDDWNSRVAKSKFAAWPHSGKSKTGHIALQDHNGEVAFRNIKIRVIQPK